MTTENFTTLFAYDTLCNADSVEWCPIEPYRDRFVCGTYQQVEEDESSEQECGRKRKGTILLFKFTREELIRECCIDTAAVLDMKWCKRKMSDKIALAVADGDGSVSIYYLTDGSLKFVADCSIRDGNEGDYLILSLCWSEIDFSICSSDSRGNVSLLRFDCGNLAVVAKWNAHSLEAWITCFDAFDPRIIYSGGDDLKLNVWDLRSEKPRKASGVSRHGAGVTVLSPHPTGSHCLASGSYDETILLWDTRNWKNPVGEITAGGGLWRLKWKPDSDSRYLLAACIYGGFEIFNTSDNSCVGRYKEHSSLAYGADWSYVRQSQNSTSGESLIATCSFYDKKLCVSLWDGNEIISTVS